MLGWTRALEEELTLRCCVTIAADPNKVIPRESIQTTSPGPAPGVTK